MIFLWVVAALDKSLFICNLLFALSVPLQCQGFSCTRGKLFFLKLSLQTQVPVHVWVVKELGWVGLILQIPWISAEQMNCHYQICLQLLVNAAECLTWDCRNRACDVPLWGGFEPWVDIHRFRKSAEPIWCPNTLLYKIMLSNSCPCTHFYLILYFLAHWQHITNNSQVIPVEVLFFISINKYVQSGIIVSFIWETKIYCFIFWSFK